MALSGVIYGTTTGIRVKAKLEWSATQDIAGNSSTVTAKLYYYKENYGTTATGGSWNGSITIDGQQFNGSSGVISLKPGGSQVLAFTAQKVVYHNADGSKTLSISASGALPPSSVTSTDLSGTITLDTIPRKASLLSAPDFNDEENPKITYRNPAGNAATSLIAKISISKSEPVVSREISKTGSSYTFKLTESERNALRNACKNANSRKVFFYLFTTIGGREEFSSLQRTLTIVNAKPTLSPVVYDSFQKTVDATGNRDVILLNASRAYFETGAVAKKGATIAGQGVMVGSKFVRGASGTVVDPDSGEFEFSVMDSRGNTVHQTVKKEVVPYVRPTARLSAKYAFATETTINITLTLQGKYYNGSFGAKSNALTLGYKYKTNSGEYSEYAYDTFAITYGSNNDYTATVQINELDYRSLYTFQCAFCDALSGWLYTAENKVKADPVFDWSGKDFNFNVPIYMYGNRSDMIVAQGTSGIWTYRKWDSGLAECWGTQHFDGPIAIATPYGSVYGCPTEYESQVIAFPFPFIGGQGDINEQCNVVADNSRSWPCKNKLGHHKNSCNGYLTLSPNVYNNCKEINYYYYVTGRWK